VAQFGQNKPGDADPVTPTICHTVVLSRRHRLPDPPVWIAYEDEQIESDILRYLYLAAEPIVGMCVESALFPLENGMLIPPTYFDRVLRSTLGQDPPSKTQERLKSNLMRLGFLARGRGKPDRLNCLVPNKTSTLLLVHYLFRRGWAAHCRDQSCFVQSILEIPRIQIGGFGSPQSCEKRMPPSSLEIRRRRPA